MHHQWRLRRATMSVADGARRWDRAYQLVLEWADLAISQPLPQTLVPTIRSGTHLRWEEEAPHADRHLRSRLNPQPSAEPDD